MEQQPSIHAEDANGGGKAGRKRPHPSTTHHSPTNEDSIVIVEGFLVPSQDALDFYEEHCTYLPAMLGWFFFSAILSSYNKYVFGDGHLKFPCPLLLTSLHFAVQWIFSHSVCEAFPQTMGTHRVKHMGWDEWASISIPCGLVTALDIGLSNLSLVKITITFYTMVKASTPIFVLGWAYLFGIERITWSLIGVMAVIALGEFLTVAGEVYFRLDGFFLCLGASFLSGARWTLVQLKLQTMDPPLQTTIATMRLLAPSMFLSMLLFSIVVERPWTTLFVLQDEDGNVIENAVQQELSRMLALGLLGGLIAVAMILCEFYLILHATAIILMIGGVIKEMITIFIGVSFFGDHLNAVNVTGCAIVFSGVILYKIVFHRQKQEAKQQALKRAQDDEDDDNVHDTERLLPAGDEVVVVPPYATRGGIELSDRKPRDGSQTTIEVVESIS